LTSWSSRRVERSRRRKVSSGVPSSGLLLRIAAGQNKEELLDMIQHGAEKIINSSTR
jgi:hypothetical protein